MEDDTIFIEKNISSDLQYRNHLVNKKAKEYDIAKEKFEKQMEKFEKTIAIYRPKCFKDCAVNKYEYDTSCYIACMEFHIESHGVYIPQR